MLYGIPSPFDSSQVPQSMPSFGSQNLLQMPQMNTGGYPQVNAGGFSLPNYSLGSTSRATEGFKMPGGLDATGAGIGLGAKPGSGGLDDFLGWFKNKDNMDMAKLGIGGLQSLASLWGSQKALGLANAQFDFSKQMAEKNYGNSVASYNTTLSDRAASRGAMQGQSQQDVQNYINKNSLR